MLCGPNIIACGKGLVAHNGHGSEENSVVMCSGVDAFMKAAREQLAAGADQLKMMYTGGMASANEGLCDMQMTDEEVKAVVDVAHRGRKEVLRSSVQRQGHPSVRPAGGGFGGARLHAV